MPPTLCASATTCSAIVVLPDDSGPKISEMRPRGNPPTPSAWSTEIEPVEMAGTVTTVCAPNRIIEPLPNCFSIWPRVAPSARLRSFSSMGIVIIPRDLPEKTLSQAEACSPKNTKAGPRSRGPAPNQTTTGAPDGSGDLLRPVSSHNLVHSVLQAQFLLLQVLFFHLFLLGQMGFGLQLLQFLVQPGMLLGQ